MNHLLEALQADPLSAAAEYYASCLPANPKAIAFAIDELQLAAEQLEADGIGFADRSLGKQIPHRRIKVGREIREQLVACGLYKATSSPCG